MFDKCLEKLIQSSKFCRRTKRQRGVERLACREVERRWGKEEPQIGGHVEMGEAWRIMGGEFKLLGDSLD